MLEDLLGFRNKTAHSGYELEERDVIWTALERHATDFADTVLTNEAIKQAYNDEWAVFRDRLKKDADRLSATFLQNFPCPWPIRTFKAGGGCYDTEKARSARAERSMTRL